MTDPMVEWLTACLDSAEADQHRTRSWRQGVPCPRCAEPVMSMSAAAFDDCATELRPCGHVVPTLEWSALLPSAADRAVLARVEAERMVLRAHTAAVEEAAALAERRETYAVDDEYREQIEAEAAATENAWESALALVAYGHRHDFPGWRKEWAPEGVTTE